MFPVNNPGGQMRLKRNVQTLGQTRAAIKCSANNYDVIAWISLQCSDAIQSNDHFFFARELQQSWNIKNSYKSFSKCDKDFEEEEEDFEEEEEEEEEEGSC